MKKLIDINTRFFESLEKRSLKSVFIHMWIRSYFIQVAIGYIVFSISKENTSLLLKIPYHALVEEVIFRHLPVFLFMLKWFNDYYHIDKRKFYLRSTIIMLISSVIFGVLHGGWINIFIQGIGGIFLFIIYLKFFVHYMSIRNDSTFYKPVYMPLLASTLFHALYNYAVVILGMVY